MVCTSPIRKSGHMGHTAAPQEEVNVLMFGVIQFSESLNYVYETTEAKIAKISQALQKHEGALQRLGKQTEQAAEMEKQMKEAIALLQVRQKKCKHQIPYVLQHGCGNKGTCRSGRM